MHTQEPFGKARINEYLKQFERDYDFKAQGFDYTYLERLTEPIDQLAILKDQVTTGISRRAQAITWRPSEDLGADSPPCLQRIWIRQLTPGNYEVHFTWRSRDAYGAWSSNLCALVNMVKREVLPKGAVIVKIVDVCNSAHVYDNDWDAASKVRLK